MTDTATDGPLRRHLIDGEGEVLVDPSRADVEARLAAGTAFWLDLPGVDDESVGWLGELFHLHPLAIEDALDFDERPKLEEYPDFTTVVLYGAAEDDGNAACADLVRRHVEVHCFVAATWLVTVHKVHSPALHELAARARARRMAVSDPARLLHRVADSLVDSFFPVLSVLDERIDDLTQDIVAGTTDAQLKELLELRSGLNALRKVVAPQRDMFASLASGVVELPGSDEDDQRYHRDVYDHLIRLAEMIDSYRDLLSGSTDAYLSVQSNRMNMVMKQLTVIATVFLPLTFLTGFFGQNFAWMVSRIQSGWAFVLLGLGTEAVALACLGVLMVRRGWLRS